MQSACAVLYCHLWLVCLYPIFRHYLINGTIFGKKVTEHKMYVLIFSTTFVWDIYHKKNSSRYHKCMYVFMQSTRYSCRILIKLEFSRHIFEKSSDIIFHQNPVVPCGRTGMTKLVVACRNYANAPKKRIPIFSSCVTWSRGNVQSLSSGHPRSWSMLF